MSTARLDHPTLLGTLWPASREARWLRAALVLLLGSALLTVTAHVKVPFWPVPMTMQTFAVLVIGMACGARLGIATVLAYLLQGALGYPFSVAVWVGYIALFGTAIQTGVVMVVYLQEAVEAARTRLGRELDRVELTEAIIAGAKLRLRPKVMTVATTVASLTPLFWLDRSGVEVMRPIAAPVVGGMISSLLHILIVTPVIFLWLHGQQGAQR